MFTLFDIWAGGVLPLAVSTAVLAATGWFLRHRDGVRESRSVAGPLAISLGFVAGWQTLLGRVEFPPVDANNWLYYLAILAAAVGMLVSWARMPEAFGVVAALLLPPLAAWLLARPLLGREDADIGPAGLIVLGLVGSGWILAMDDLARRVSASRAAMILLCAWLPASMSLIFSGSQRLGQICGLLAATLLAWIVLRFAQGPAGRARGVMLVVGVVYLGLLFAARLYSELRTPQALLLFLAPLAAAGLRFVLGRRDDRWVPLVQCALVAGIAGIVLVWTGVEFFAKEAAYEY